MRPALPGEADPLPLRHEKSAGKIPPEQAFGTPFSALFRLFPSFFVVLGRRFDGFGCVFVATLRGFEDSRPSRLRVLVGRCLDSRANGASLHPPADRNAITLTNTHSSTDSRSINPGEDVLATKCEKIQRTEGRRLDPGDRYRRADYLLLLNKNFSAIGRIWSHAVCKSGPHFPWPRRSTIVNSSVDAVAGDGSPSSTSPS